MTTDPIRPIRHAHVRRIALAGDLHRLPDPQIAGGLPFALEAMPGTADMRDDILAGLR